MHVSMSLNVRVLTATKHASNRTHGVIQRVETQPLLVARHKRLIDNAFDRQDSRRRSTSTLR